MLFIDHMNSGFWSMLLPDFADECVSLPPLHTQLQLQTPDWYRQVPSSSKASESTSKSYQLLSMICTRGSHLLSKKLILAILERMISERLVPGFAITRECKRTKSYLLMMMDNNPSMLAALSDASVAARISLWYQEIHRTEPS